MRSSTNALGIARQCAFLCPFTTITATTTTTYSCPFRFRQNRSTLFTRLNPKSIKYPSTVYYIPKRRILITARFEKSPSGFRRDEQSPSGEKEKWIFHIYIEKMFRGSLSQAIVKETNMPLGYVRELISLGAVYVAQVKKSGLKSASTPPSHTKKNASNEKNNSNAATVPARMNRKAKPKPTSPFSALSALSSTSPSALPRPLLTKVERVTTEIPVGTGHYIRVYTDPMRYPDVKKYNWPRRIIYEDDSLVAVDKPSGIPSVPNVDNIIENAKAQLELHKYRGSAPLHAVSRLDVCTSGVLLFAKTPESAKYLNLQISNRMVRKSYIALCAKAMPELVGTELRHLVRSNVIDGVAKPRIYRSFDGNNAFDLAVLNKGPQMCNFGGIWQIARMNILSMKAVRCVLSASQDSKGEEGGEGEEAENKEKEFYEYEIQLITGRTHQIRLQMAALGNPLIGDSRYVCVSGRTHRNVPEDDRLDWFGREPWRVGLFACQLELTPPQEFQQAVINHPGLLRAAMDDDNESASREELERIVEAIPKLTIRSNIDPWWRRVE